MPKGNSGGEDRAKVKLRVIEFELEGGNASVENSIRQLTQALTTRTNGTPAKQLPPRTPAALPAGADEEADNPDEVTDAEFAEGADVPAAPAKPRTPRRPTVPEPIEVDLAIGDMPFQQFCDERGITASSTDTK